MTSARRRTATAAAVAVLGVLASMALTALAALVSAAPAEAAAYRYWTYWWGKPDATSWTFANLGPAGHKVADRSVEGWRFAVSTTTGGKQPRTSASYEDHCSDAPADGKVRVALIVDFGSTSDAPPGESPPNNGTIFFKCMVEPAGTTGATLLQKAGLSPFYEKGLLCALSGYPENECAAVVTDPTPTPTKTSASPKPTPSTSRTTATAAASTSAAAPDSSTSARPTTSTDRASAPATTSAPATASSAPAVVPSSESASPEAEATLPVSSGSPVAAAPEQDGGGSAGGFVVGALVALGIGGAAWWTARGRSV